MSEIDYRRLAETTVGNQAASAVAEPQPMWTQQLEAGDVAIVDGVAFMHSRAVNDCVLRGHEFSTDVDFGLGNVRPLIPLNVDPPKHAQYRKLLDPVFAPRRMEEQELDITERFNGFIDAFIDRGECNFTEELAELFPSSVFLGLCGLPEADLRTFLTLRDGVLHPEKVDPAAATDLDARLTVTKAGGQAIYEYFTEIVTKCRAELNRRPGQPLDRVRGRWSPSQRRRTARHPLPHAHRRAGHGQRFANVLLRFPGHPPRSPAPDCR